MQTCEKKNKRIAKYFQNYTVNFHQLVANETFLRWNCHDVVRLLGDDQIAIRNELEVLDAAIKWLIHDWPKRQRNVVSVLSQVRFGLMKELEILCSLYDPQASDVWDTPGSKDFPLWGIAYHRAICAKNLDIVAKLRPKPRAKLVSFFKLDKDDSTKKSDCDQAGTVENGNVPEVTASIMKWAATVIQSTFRGYRVRRVVKFANIAATIIQRRFRKYMFRKRTAQLNLAACRVQTTWRRHQARKEMVVKHLAATVIQATWRGHRVKEQYLLQKEACSVIATAWRTFLVQKEFQQDWLCNEKRSCCRPHSPKYCYKSYNTERSTCDLK